MDNLFGATPIVGMTRGDLFQKTPVERSLFDQTAGAFAYGAADVAGLASRGIGSIIPGNDPFEQFGNSLKGWMEEHPQYAPEEVSSVLDLISKPGAMLGRLSSGLPYLIGTAALLGAGPIAAAAGATAGVAAGIGAAGLPLAMGLTFGVEARRGFESGKADGLSDGDATTKGVITGTIAGMLNLIPIQRLFRAGHGVETSLLGALTDKAVMAAKGVGAVREAAQFVAMQTVLGTLGGSVDDLVSRGLYGKPLPKDMLDKILQNAVIALPNAELGGFAFKKILGGAEGQGDNQVKRLVGDSFGLEDLRQVAIQDFKYDEKGADAVTRVTGAMAGVYARRNNISVSEAMTKLFAKDPGGDLGGQVLAQEAPVVQGFFSQLRKTVDGLVQENWLSKDLLPYLKKSTKDEELEWTGVGGLLKSKTKVTKEELQTWLNEREVKILEKVRGGEGNKEFQENLAKLHDERIELQNEMQKLVETEIKTPEQQAQIREQTTQLGQRIHLNLQAQDAIREQAWGGPNNDPHYSSYTLLGGSNYREILLRFPSDDYSFSQNPHWEEPDVIVHLRTTDREVGGKKVLFLEEVQSDWHQQGRESGYLPKKGEDKPVYDSSGRRQVPVRDIDVVHPAPFKDSWPDLALKKAILLAVEEGHDSIAWTTGDQQVERYGEMLTEKQRSGLKKFYDEILPQKMKDLVRRYDKDVKVRQEQLTIDKYKYGPTGEVFRDSQGLDTNDPDLKSFKQNENVLAITLSDILKRRISSEGLPLFQSGKSTPPPPTKSNTYKAVIDDKDHMHIMEAESHQDLIMSLGLKPRNLKATGLVAVDKDGTVIFSGTKDGVGMYDKEFQSRSSEDKMGRVDLAEVSPESYTWYGKVKKNLNQRLGLELFQSNRGSVTFLKTGQAVLRALANPDGSTMLHEIFHVFRRVLEGQDLKTLEDWAGVKDGTWEVEHEERAAKGWERYLLEGKAPSPELDGVFKYIKEIFKLVYQSIKSLGRDTVLNDEVRGVFDRMVYEDSSPVTAQRLNLREMNVRLARVKSGLLDDGSKPPSNIPPEIERVQKAIRVKDAEAKAKEASEELEKAKAQNFRPGIPSEVEGLSDFRASIPLSIESPNRGAIKRALHDVGNFVKSWMYYATDLKDTKGGRLFEERVYEQDTTQRTWKGEFEPEKTAILHDLSWRDQTDMMRDPTDDGSHKYGFTLASRLAEPTAIPDSAKLEIIPTEPQSRFVRFMNRVHNFFGERSEELDVQRRFRKGKQSQAEPVRISENPTKPRSITPEAFHVFTTKQGEKFQAVVAALQELHPDMDLRKISEKIDKLYSPEARMKRVLGAVEEVRSFKFFPDYVRLKDGTIFPLQHMDVREVMTHAVNRQAERLAFIEQFGQNVLRTVKTPLITKLIGILGRSKDFQEALQPLLEKNSKGKYTDLRSADTISTELFNKDIPLDPSKRKNYEIAKMVGIPIRLTREELLATLQDYDARRITKVQTRQLIQLAREMKGISTTDTTPQKLLFDIVKRAKEEVPRYLVKQLRDLHIAEGGSEESFNQAVALAQGIPIYELGTGLVARGTRFVSGLIGGLQTSGAVAPNISQTAVQLPQLFKLKNYLAAVTKVMTDPQTSRAMNLAFGSMPATINTWTMEPGRSVEAVGRWLLQGIAKGTGQRDVAQFNNVLAGETAKQWMENIKGVGADKRDMGTARTLHLNEKELVDFQKGVISERTYKKVIQRTVAQTQFVTENPLFKSKLELNPITNMLFSYNSYMLGTLRANVEVGKALASAFRNRDPGEIFHQVMRSGSLVAGTLGAGAFALILRQAIKGDFRQARVNDENIEQLAVGALAEAGLFGPAHWVMNSFNYDRGITEKAVIGFMPQISALIDVFDAAVGRGQFGKFAPGKRFKEAALQNTPLAKGFRNWFDASAYPELVEYKDAREASSKWRRSNVQGSGQALLTEAQFDPEYYHVFEGVQRFDIDLAREGVKETIKEAIKNGKGQKIPEIMDNLRASLVARSPLPFSAQNLSRFLGSLPEETRGRYLRSQSRYMRIVDQVAPR